MDAAHNEAGLEALVEIMRGLRPPGRCLLLGLGAVGDRQDDLIELLGEIAARDADVVAIGHKERYLRGRTVEELESLLRAGAERVGMTDIAAFPTELDSLRELVNLAEPGDVVGLLVVNGVRDRFLVVRNAGDGVRREGAADDDVRRKARGGGEPVFQSFHAQPAESALPTDDDGLAALPGRQRDEAGRHDRSWLGLGGNT